MVRLYASKDEKSLIGELVKDVDYSFVADKNAIRFEAEQVPPSEAYIVVEYRVLAEGTQVESGEAE